MLLKKIIRKKRRIKRVRAKIFGTAECPRLAVFRSLKHIYIQLINDKDSTTILAFSDFDLKNKNKVKKSEKAFLLGQELAKKTLLKKIEKVVFDKRDYKYHGVIKFVADGARKGGLNF